MVFMNGRGKRIKKPLITNKPNITDKRPPITENKTIFCGLSDMFRAIAAGIISIPVISNNPTI